MPSDAYGGANPGRESMHFTLLPYPVIQFPEVRSSLNPRRLVGDVDVDGPQVKHVEDDERILRPVRYSVIVVPSAADLKVQIEGFRAEYSRRDMGLLSRGDDDVWLRSGRGVVT